MTLVAMMSACVAGSGQGTSLSVNPIGFDLSRAAPASVLKISNAGNEAVRLQVTGFDWYAEAGKEQLVDNDSLVINPPIFSIAPGGVQFVRFGPRHLAGGGVEQAFRLLVDEVPSGQAPEGSMRTLLRISIPVFIAPHMARDGLAWQILQAGSGYILSARNDGNIHQKIVHLNVLAADDVNGVDLKPALYLLAGQQAVWPLMVAPRAAQTGSVRLSIRIDKVESDAHLTLDLP